MLEEIQKKLVDMRRIQDVFDSPLSSADIADITNLSVATVYRYRNKDLSIEQLSLESALKIQEAIDNGDYERKLKKQIDDEKIRELIDYSPERLAYMSWDVFRKSPNALAVTVGETTDVIMLTFKNGKKLYRVVVDDTLREKYQLIDFYMSDADEIKTLWEQLLEQVKADPVQHEKNA